MRKLPPKSTGSFDRVEAVNIVPRRDSNNTADDRIILGGKSGDIITFKSGTIVEGLEQATTGNAPDLSEYPTKEEMELALAKKEDVSVGDTHALKTDVESLDAEDIKAVPLGMQSDYYPSANGDTNKDINISSDIQNVGDAIAYNLELTRLLAMRTNEVINNATTTNFVGLDMGSWPTSLKDSFTKSTPDIRNYNQTQMNSFFSLELDKEIRNREETDENVQSNHEDILDLQVELEALAPTLEAGQWKYTTGFGVRPGEIKIGSDSYTVKDEVVFLSDVDSNGTTHGFSNVEVGTYLEFVEDDIDYGLYQVTEKKVDIGIFEFRLNLIKGLGAPANGDPVRVRAFEAGEVDFEGMRIVDIDDEPPVEPKEGNLWFDNNEEDMTLRVYQEESEAWIPVAPATTVEGRVSAGEATQRAIQITIDNALMDQALISAKPPGVKFWYQSDSSSLREKQFQWYENDTRLKISAKGVNVDWLSEGFEHDYSMSNGPYFTIYHMPNLATPTDRPQWKVRKHGRISRIDWHSNHILCYISSQHSSSGLANGATYYITIGGII